jgi:integrase
MDKEKIFSLAGQLLLAGVSQNDEEINRIVAEIAKAMQTQNSIVADETTTSKHDIVGFLKFTNEEILKMPKILRNTFRAEGCTVHYRKRQRGNSLSYEIRYNRHGISLSVSARTLLEAKRRFIELLHNTKTGNNPQTQKQQNFAEFGDFWFEKFHIRKVTTKTFYADQNRYKRHIRPYFGDYNFNEINPYIVQNFLDKYGKSKTADENYSLLNQIFKAAINFGYIERNPLVMVFHRKHTGKHGTALTKEEERYLLESVKGTPYEIVFAVILYTGLRPNEYKTAKLENGFIMAVNSKQKDGKVHYKKIPVCPMLSPYLVGVSQIKMYGAECTRDKFNKILPNHILYDLRTTFYTRCQECGVSELARNLFVGHSLKGLAGTYTDVSDEYLIQEAQKIKY